MMLDANKNHFYSKDRTQPPCTAFGSLESKKLVVVAETGTDIIQSFAFVEAFLSAMACFYPVGIRMFVHRLYTV